jgi:hypothetical protein
VSGRILTTALYEQLDDRQILALEQRVAARAKCRQPGVNPDDWFPVSGESEHASELVSQNTAAYAREVCAGCPVITSCLKLSLDIPQGQWGVWGGLSARERRQMLRARSRNAAQRRGAAARRRVVELAAAAEASEQQVPAAAGVAS